MSKIINGADGRFYEVSPDSVKLRPDVTQAPAKEKGAAEAHKGADFDDTGSSASRITP